MVDAFSCLLCTFHRSFALRLQHLFSCGQNDNAALSQNAWWSLAVKFSFLVYLSSGHLLQSVEQKSFFFFFSFSFTYFSLCHTIWSNCQHIFSYNTFLACTLEWLCIEGLWVPPILAWNRSSSSFSWQGDWMSSIIIYAPLCAFLVCFLWIKMYCRFQQPPLLISLHSQTSSLQAHFTSKLTGRNKKEWKADRHGDKERMKETDIFN